MENKIVKIGYGYVSDTIEKKKETLFTMKIVASIINRKGLGRTKLYELVRKLEYLEPNNCAKQKYIDEGYFENSVTRRDMGGVHGKTNQILITIKGLELIKKIVNDSVTT
jgi:phage antirepressor YoqD-like protein